MRGDAMPHRQDAMRPIRIAFISTSRSDFATIEPVLRGALADKRFQAKLLICGQHLTANTPLPEEIAGIPALRLRASSESINGVSQRALYDCLLAEPKDFAFVVGDRFELLSVLECCTIARVPIGHCSGGERTFGAFDDQIRDAATKLAHLHFVAHKVAAERVRSLQEENWRIAITGDPGLDSIRQEKRVTPPELEALLGVSPAKCDIVAAIHPATRSPEETTIWLQAIAELSRDFPGRIFLSSPNGDPGSDAVQACWEKLEAPGKRIVLPTLGAKLFRALIAACGAFVGNSSAGIWEVPSLGIPSLDLGSRQAGRLRGNTVWHCEVETAGSLLEMVRLVLSAQIQNACQNGENPYGDGHATPRILDHIAQCIPEPRLMVKE